MTAKKLFDHVAKSREEGVTVPYQTAMRNLLNTKFSTTVEDYCDNFIRNYLGVNSAGESMIRQSSNSDTVNPFVIPHGIASHLFIIGTEAVEWLSTWRQTKVFDNSNHYVSLETMMSTLRQTGAGKTETMGRAMKMNGPGRSASEKPRGLDPNSRCELCRYPQNNSECYKQHPELAPKSKLKKRRGKKGKAKASAGNEIFDDKDNSDDDGVSLASEAKIPQLA
eukprot:NODE_297_length_1234_cov_1466.945992_g176_i0.p1 GENE.NODE_297_length_1234_cov_1466.945992_g176_i0~~NODE_297_length_1234_cov_1466.945992_g176_i0.p1  ORF type:complete len:223 (-),score=18.05 NODE_297_length_1234_cov_1466.945992_g176_i0:63-731(-)